MLGRTARVLQCQCDGYIAHKVDVTDVDKDLGSIESELAEAEIDVVVGIRRVENRWLNETWTRVDFECQWRTYREPYSAACYAWDRCLYCISRSAETDCDVGVDWRACRRRTGRVVWSLCICRKNEDRVVVVNSQARCMNVSLVSQAKTKGAREVLY